MKYVLVEAEKTEHRISRLCSVLGVTRQGFYAWRGAGRVNGNWAMRNSRA